MSSARSRIAAVSDHLLRQDNKVIIANRFRPKLPFGLNVSFTPLNPLTFLLKCASIKPNHIAIECADTGRRWTFEEWATRVSHLAYAVRSRGLRSGDKAFVCSPNTPFCADLIQGIAAAGAIITPVNTRLTQDEVDYLLVDSEAKIIFVDHLSAHLFKNAKVPVIICSDGAAGDLYEAFLEEGARFDQSSTGGLGWEGLEFNTNELATFSLCYTSGTTNRPKGVESSYRGTYLAAIANCVESGMNHDSKYLWILPMFHCVGWCFPFSSTMAMATQVCMRSANYDQIWDLILNHGVTHYCGAPTVQLSILNHPLARQPSQPVRTSIAGAAPTASLIEGLEAIGITVNHVYGLTETYGPVSRSYSSVTTDKMKQGAAFLTADDVRVVKLIPEGEELTTTELVEVACDGLEVGEIVFRGNIVMKGYFKNELATRKAFAGGYFHTGDLAVRYPDGTYMIQDRSKDIIISGGENISSLSIESTLTSHPDISEIACVARLSEKWGETPYAFIVLIPSSKYHGRPEEFLQVMRAFARDKMPGFAIPSGLEIVTELEKTSTGKVSKKSLRDGLRARDAASKK